MSLAAGRERAAARVDAGAFAPHPGWRNWAPPDRLVDQAVVLRFLDRLLAAQSWRADRRTAWTAILRRLVCAATWPPDPTRPRTGAERHPAGLVTGCSVAQLAAAADRSARTVSRAIAWAVAEGLLVVLEEGASAAFLGSQTGRTPTYAFYRPPGLDAPRNADPAPAPDLDHDGAPAGAGTVTAPDPNRPDPPTTGTAPTSTNPLNGDLPSSNWQKNPLNNGLEPANTDRLGPWPLFGVPLTASDRDRALGCLFGRIGLDGGGVPGVARWRARAMFASWWAAGWCPAALLWAIDHHPDHPDRPRGDALRGARDPLRVLGHRLAPWAGRRRELPATLAGLPGDYTRLVTSPTDPSRPVAGRLGRWPSSPGPVASAHSAAHQVAQDRPVAQPAAQPPAQPSSERGPEALAAMEAFRAQQRARGVRPVPIRRRRRGSSRPR